MKSMLPTKEETKKTPARRELLAPFASLQHEMNKLFDELRGGWNIHPSVFEQLGDFHAKVDMKDNDKDIVVSAELPGVEMKDINISLNGETLVLKGEKKVEKEEKEKGYYRMERSYGSFYRAIPLPCEVEQNAVDAIYKDGVLTVTLPKSKDSIKNEKQINIKAG
ncbi:Hsp20/alpha crystallin family protein [Candidatus Obscuribacterales bacterium]|nr:Hsp20/alpha crystallin family protein [Candidatus Obscuribacterales bacterium]